MSTDAFIIKSKGSLLSFNQSNFDTVSMADELPWPYPPHIYLALYKACSEHARAIHIKAEGAFGNGLAQPIAALENVCPTGVTDLVVSLALDMECYGNAFLHLVRTPNQTVVELKRLPALTMCRTPNGYLQRVLNAQGREVIHQFKRDDLLHLRPPCVAGGYYSLPAWIGGVGMIELVYAAIRFNAKFFDHSAIPEYVIVTKGAQLSDTQKTAAQDFFKREFQGLDNSHRTLYLHLTDSDAEIEFKRVTAEVKDGDFLKLLDAARDRLPIAHGVPPRMMGIVSAGQLGGGGEVAGQFHVFEELTLKPRRRRMIDQLRPLWRALNIPVNQVQFAPLSAPDIVADTTPTLKSAAANSDMDALTALYSQF